MIRDKGHQAKNVERAQTVFRETGMGLCECLKQHPISPFMPGYARNELIREFTW